MISLKKYRPKSDTGKLLRASKPDGPVILARKAVYKSPWIDLYLDKVKFPGGRIVPEHHCLDFRKEGVAAVVENKRGEILLIQSYRYMTDSVDWEIPAGGREGRESVLSAASREVLEETGYETKRHSRLYTFYPITGIGNLAFHVVLCEAGRRLRDHDPNEVFSVRWFSKKRIREMIRTKMILDGFALTGLLLFLGICDRISRRRKKTRNTYCGGSFG